MNKKVGMISLGCPKNQVDAEVMLGILTQSGYEIVSRSEDADIIVVNTCGFIDPAKEESIDTILEQVKYKQKGSCRQLIVTGCLAERYKQELIDEIPEIDAVIGTGNYNNIVNVIESSERGLKAFWDGNIDCSLEYSYPRMLTTPSHTAYLKIAEGCDNHCAYCIIPQLRGKYRSRNINSLINEANALVKNGVKELILIAQDITRYGQDLGGKLSLVNLLQHLCDIPDLKWIRLMYCYPDRISDDLINIIAKEEKICKYIDIPIQHINGSILKKMNRHLPPEEIKKLIKKIADRIPNAILRTSLMVGFPGEGEEEFNELMDFIQEFPFQRIGVFKYSREEGTLAAQFPMQVSEETKEARRSRLMVHNQRITKRLNRRRVGDVYDVLIEGKHSTGVYVGRSYGEAPGIDGEIFVTSKEPIGIGEFVKVRIMKSYEYDLVGEAYEFSK